MKKPIPVLLVSALVAMGSSSSPAQTPAAPQPPASSTASAPAPTPASAVPSISPASGKAAGASKEEDAAKKKAEDAAKEKEIRDRLAAMAGLRPSLPAADDEDGPKADPIIVDQATGKRLLRVMKAPYLVVQKGRLFNTLTGRPGEQRGEEIVREDANYYYVEAPEVPPASPSGPDEKVPEDLPMIVPVAKSEGEVVTPKGGAKRLRFVESSAGLPKSGMWRENLAVGDLEGDGRNEIVAPNPRLGGLGISVFRLDGAEWKKLPVKVDIPAGQPTLEYGGVALGDYNRDGKLDIAYIQHGGWPRILLNQGELRFKSVTAGMPSEPSGRSIAIADVDGDGRPDVVTVSDDDEWENLPGRDGQGRPLPAPGAQARYLKGYNVRVFLQQADGTVREADAGLEPGCYAHALAVRAVKKDTPALIATGCSYLGWESVLFEYDAKGKKWVAGPPRDVVEQYAIHAGVAVGTYRGKPAAFVSYLKSGPVGASPEMGGYGLSVYYKDGKSWKRERILKVIGNRVPSKALAVGDLDGDGLDDIVWADGGVGRVRVFFQKVDGTFEEMDAADEPTYKNRATSLAIADVDGDGRKDVVLMYEYFTGAKSRAGGIRAFLSKK